MDADSHFNSIHEDLKNLELNINEVISKPKTENPQESTPPETNNRRFVLRPRKRSSLTLNENNNGDNDLVNIYNMDNKRTRLSPNAKKRNHSLLETIFEEPVIKKNGSVLLVGKPKVKRSITFSDFITKTKQNKRKALIKKHKIGKTKSRNLKLSVKDIESKLEIIDNEQSVN